MTRFERVERIASFKASRDREKICLLAQGNPEDAVKPDCNQKLDTSLR